MIDPIFRTYELISGKITANCPTATQADCCLMVGGLEIKFSITSRDYGALVEQGFLHKMAQGKTEANLTTGDITIID